MIAWRSAGTRWYQPARYSASCSFKGMSGLLLGLCLSDDGGPSSRFQYFLHLRPGIGREALERGPIGIGHAIEDRGIDRGPRGHPRPPFGDARVALAHATELEEFEAQDIGNHGAVCIGKALAGQVRAALQRVRHPRQELPVMRKRLGHELGVEPVLDDATLVLCAALEPRLADFGLPALSPPL